MHFGYHCLASVVALGPDGNAEMKMGLKCHVWSSPRPL